jgi:hypothetical protein
MRATKMLLLKKKKRKPRKHQIALEIKPFWLPPPVSIPHLVAHARWDFFFNFAYF